MTGQAWVWVVVAIIVALLVGWVINRSRNRSTATVGSSAPAAVSPAVPPSEESPVATPAGVAPLPAAPADAPVAAPVMAPPAEVAPTGAAPPEAVPSSAESNGSAAALQVVPEAYERASDPALAALDSATPLRAPAPAAAVPPAPPAPGAALPNADGSAPSGEYVIKAVDASKRFHDASSPVYSVVRADLYFRDPEAASAAGFRYWKASRKRAVAPSPATAAPDAPYPGAALPAADGSAPSGEYAIKAVTGSKRYHDVRSPVYSVLRADVLFRDPEAAAAAGFASWKGGSSDAAPDDAPARVAPHPGAAFPHTDGSAPAGYRIKAVEGSKRYHDPSSPVYAVLRADVLFRDPDAARAAGYRYWRSKR